MAEVNGKLVTCDRCGTQIFLRVTGEKETDGGFTRWNTFEPYPEGWGLVAIPKCDKAPSENTRNDYIRVCPECHKLWDNTIKERFLKGTKYYEGDAGNGN